MKQRSFVSLLCALLLSFFITSCTRPPLPPPIILFDSFHGQLSDVGSNEPTGLSQFRDLFSQQGFSIRTHAAPFTAQNLTNIDAVAICGPTKPLAATEITALVSYLAAGGQLVLLVRDVPALSPLLGRLQVAIAHGLVREQAPLHGAQETDIIVQNLPSHPLTKNLSSFTMHGAWPLKTALVANIIGQTSRQSWVDLNNNSILEPGDAQQPFPVLITGQIGHGHFVVFADDSLFENRYVQGENKKLGENLARWFKEGSYY